MFNFLFGWATRKKELTFKAFKEHGTEKRQTLSRLCQHTLGSGDLRGAVRLPPEEDLNEWLAANTDDFFNETSLLWGIICDVNGTPSRAVGEGFPPGYEYRWATGGSGKPQRLSGPAYVDAVLSWVEGEINDSQKFPVGAGVSFPRKFVDHVSLIFSRLFRIYAIVYTNFFAEIESVGAVAHLNTSFKHFLFFSWEFNLIKDQEFEAVGTLVQEIKSKYEC